MTDFGHRKIQRILQTCKISKYTSSGQGRAIENRNIEKTTAERKLTSGTGRCNEHCQPAKIYILTYTDMYDTKFI